MGRASWLRPDTRRSLSRPRAHATGSDAFDLSSQCGVLFAPLSGNSIDQEYSTKLLPESRGSPSLMTSSTAEKTSSFQPSISWRICGRCAAIAADLPAQSVLPPPGTLDAGSIRRAAQNCRAAWLRRNASYQLTAMPDSLLVREQGKEAFPAAPIASAVPAANRSQRCRCWRDCTFVAWAFEAAYFSFTSVWPRRFEGRARGHWRSISKSQLRVAGHNSDFILDRANGFGQKYRRTRRPRPHP